MAWTATTFVLAARDFLAVGTAVGIRALVGGSLKSGNCTKSEECDDSDLQRLGLFTIAVVLTYLWAGNRTVDLGNAAIKNREPGLGSAMLRVAPACIFAGAMSAAYMGLGTAGALAVATRVLVKQGYCVVRDTCAQILSRLWWLKEHSSFPGHNLRLVDQQLNLVGGRRHSDWVDSKVLLATMFYFVWAVGGQFLSAKLKADFKSLADQHDEHMFLPEVPQALTTEVVEVLDVFTIGLAALLAARWSKCTLVLDPTPQPTGSLTTAIANNAGARIAFLSMGDMAAILGDFVDSFVKANGMTETLKLWQLAAQLAAGTVLAITEPRGWLVALGSAAIAASQVPAPRGELAEYRPMDLEVAWQIGEHDWHPQLAYVAGSDPVQWVTGRTFDRTSMMVECVSTNRGRRQEQQIAIGDLHYKPVDLEEHRRQHIHDSVIV